MDLTHERTPRWVFLVAVLASCLVLVVSGCDSESGGGGGSDGDTDADTDSDIDADAGPDGGEDFEIDPQRIYDDVAWLSHDDRGGRLPGMEGNEDALDYVESLFVDLGLSMGGDSDTFRQAFDYDRFRVTAAAAAAVDSTDLEVGVDFRVFDMSGSADVTGELEFVSHALTIPPFDTADYPMCPIDPGGYDDFGAVEVTDKIVVALRHGPDDD